MTDVASRSIVLTLALTTTLAAACDSTESEEAADPNDAATCAEVPRAYVFPGANAPELEALLSEAGFEVRALALDRSPDELTGLIVFPSYVSAGADYERYMDDYAGDLYEFVDRANVVLQLAQDDESELEPPFLPSTHGAERSDESYASLRIVSPDHPFVDAVEEHEGELTWTGELASDAFVHQSGFEVVLSGGAEEARPVLMEGAYGQGRIVLAAMRFDRPSGEGNEARLEFARTFLANLAGHVDDVCERDAYALTPTPSDQAAVPFESDSWVLATLPDTQVYSLRYPGVFDSQTAWLARHAEELDIRFVTHLGDVVNNNSDEEWARARDSMAVLEGVLPFSIAPGNHDYGPSGDASTRETLLNDYFDFDALSQHETFGGAFVEGQSDNTFHLFTAGGRDWILLSLEWGPRDEVLEWANEVMDAHADRTGILATHAYLYNDDRRYDYGDPDAEQKFNPHDYATPGGVNDGEEIWQKLVRHHDFAITLNGHVLGDGTGYLASETDTGMTCHQMLANFQMRELGGEGYFRLLEFRSNERVLVRSYSPLHDAYLLEYDQQFEFELD